MIFNDDSMMIQDFIMIHELCKSKTSKHTITQQDLKHERAASASPRGSRPGSRFDPRSGSVTGWQSVFHATRKVIADLW